MDQVIVGLPIVAHRENVGIAVALWVGSEEPERPDHADEVYALRWDKAGIIVPWPKGISFRQALIYWAKQQSFN